MAPVLRFLNQTPTTVSLRCNMVKLMQTPTVFEGDPHCPSPSLAPVSDVEPDFEDLVHAWRRLRGPGLRRLAIRLIRTLGQEAPYVDDGTQPPRSLPCHGGEAALALETR